MKLYKAIGNVTLSRCLPSFDGAKLLATEPEGLQTYGQQPSNAADLVIVWDDRGAGDGSLLAVSDGAEAAQAFRPELKPVDAYCSAILDSVHVDPQAVRKLKLD